MELSERLKKIESAVLQLQMKCEDLQSDNERLKMELAHYKEVLSQKEELLNNLEEQNKNIKLAEGHPGVVDNSELKAQIDELIEEIDRCIKLVE